jgi:GNAT superfamily N-acetyltransferase
MRVDFESSISLHRDGPGDYASIFVASDGKMIMEESDHNDEEEHDDLEVGQIRIVLFDADRAREAGIDIVLAADGVNGDYLAVAEEFYKINGEELDCIFSPNILYVSDVHVDEKYRGRGLGLAAIRRAVDLFAINCRYAVIIPKPQPIKGQDNPDWKPTKTSEAKLRRYYRRAGFKNLKGTIFMVLDLDAPVKDVLLSRS